MQSLNPDPKARYTSIYGALKRIMHTEGFWRPLRGLNVMMMGAGPAHAMYFACYENMKRTLNDVFSHQGNSHLANGILKAFVWSWEALLFSACSLGASSPGPSSLHPRQFAQEQRTLGSRECAHTFLFFIQSLFLRGKLVVDVFWYYLVFIIVWLFFFFSFKKTLETMISHRKKNSFECWMQNKTQKRTASLRLFKNWYSRYLQRQDLTKL